MGEPARRALRQLMAISFTRISALFFFFTHVLSLTDQNRFVTLYNHLMEIATEKTSTRLPPPTSQLIAQFLLSGGRKYYFKVLSCFLASCLSIHLIPKKLHPWPHNLNHYTTLFTSFKSTFPNLNFLPHLPPSAGHCFLEAVSLLSHIQHD